MSLTADELRTSLEVIALWRSDPDATLGCPRCRTLGLTLADRSARPYAEWYHLACAECGLDETIHIPLGSPGMGDAD